HYQLRTASRSSTLSLHDALPICHQVQGEVEWRDRRDHAGREAPDQAELALAGAGHGEVERLPGDARRLLGGDEERAPGSRDFARSEEHTSELQSRSDLVCRLLLE